MQEEQIIKLASGFTQYPSDMILGIEDDAALFKPEAGFIYSWCVDTLVENTHFLRTMPARAVGWKALAVNLSDLAAMNAQPVACLLSLGLPADTPDVWIQQFFNGLRVCCERYKVNLAGGDTVKQSSEINISLSVLGKTMQPFKRKGAQAGDFLVLTGNTHGASAAGLSEFIKTPQKNWANETQLGKAQQTHLYPQPRFEAVESLAKLSRSHVLDTSDSLLKSVRLLAELNELGCEIESQLIPAYVTPDHPKFQSWVLQGGEDFELLAAVPPQEAKYLPEDMFTVIGKLTPHKKKYTLHSAETRIAFSELGEGYKHF